MASLKIKRVNMITKEEKEYLSIADAAKQNNCHKGTLRKYAKSGVEYKGYIWIEAGMQESGWERWKIEYLRSNYTGPQSISQIATKIKKTDQQVKNKVKYLGLRVVVDEQLDEKEMDYKNYKERIEKLKNKVHKGSEIRVEFYCDDVDDHARKAKKVIEAVVDGCYEHFINVVINGARRSYSWGEILGVVEE